MAYMEFEGYICCWHMYGCSMVNKSGCLMFFLLVCKIMQALYGDYSNNEAKHINEVKHMYSVAGIFLRGICQ